MAVSFVFLQDLSLRFEKRNIKVICISCTKTKLRAKTENLLEELLTSEGSEGFHIDFK